MPANGSEGCLFIEQSAVKATIDQMELKLRAVWRVARAGDLDGAFLILGMASDIAVTAIKAHSSLGDVAQQEAREEPNPARDDDPPLDDGVDEKMPPRIC